MDIMLIILHELATPIFIRALKPRSIFLTEHWRHEDIFY